MENNFKLVLNDKTDDVNEKIKDIVRNWLNIQPSPRKFNNNTRNKHI